MPFPHGYADWGRYEARAARTYQDATFNNLSVSGSFSTILTEFVGDVPRLSLFIRATTANWQVAVQFYSDDPLGAGTILHQMAFDLLQGMTWAHSVQVPAPWLAILVRPSAATNEIASRVTESTQHGLTQFGLGGADNVIISRDTTVGASTSSSFSADQIWPGQAHFSFSFDPFVPITFELNTTVAVSGFITRVLQIINPCDQSVWGIVNLPAAPIRFTATNDGTVSTNVRAIVSGQLAQPGI